MIIESIATIIQIVVCVMTTSIQGQPVAVILSIENGQDCLSEAVSEQHRRWS